MYSMLYNGQSVHAYVGDTFDENKHQGLWDSGESYRAVEYFESCLVPYYDEDGEPIPTSKCICGAHYPGECGCACDSWTENDWEE